MNARSIATAMILTVVLLPLRGAAAGEDLWDFLKGRLELGTRITEFDLETESTAPNPDDAFLGNLYKLDPEQNTDPTKIFVDFNIIEYWGVEWTWDEMAATPINFGRDEKGITSTLATGNII